MPQPIRIPFPKKGINRNFARSDQNGVQQGFGQQVQPETCWNALNVLPYDRFDRLRGGQRPGTVRLQSSALDSSSSVVMLAGTTTALDASTLTPSQVLVNDNFPGSYTTGARLDTQTSNYLCGENGGNLDGLLGNPLTGAVDLLVQTTGLQNNSALNNAVVAEWHQALTLPSGFSVKATFTNTSTSFSTYGVFARRSDSTVGQTPTYLQVTLVQSNTGNTTLIIANGSGGAALFSGPITNPCGVPAFTLELRVAGTTVSVFINGGAALASITSSSGAGFVGCGLMIGKDTSSNFASPRVTNFTILGVPQQAVYRQNNIVAVCGSNVYEGDSTGLPLATNGTGVVTGSGKPGFAYGQGFLYIVDGVSIYKVNLGTKTVVAYAATAGTAPTLPTIAAMYRDRLVLSGQVASPQNFYMSRSGTHTDWDYSQTDPAAAFAGNASTAGHIGEPITALMPFNDDVMLIGGDHNLWRVNGDPADGGSIDLVSDSIGVLGQFAWTKAPTGEIYFIGTGGLYKVVPGGVPQLMSDQTYNQYFTSIDRAANYISMAWDRDRQGLYIYVTPVIATGTAGTHLFYDARNGGLWPVQYPDTFGPISVLLYDGDNSTNRLLLLGSRNGLVQKVSSTALDDDGAAISSSLTLGPFQPSSPTGDAVVTGLDVTLGENLPPDATTVINCNWTVNGGKTAYEVTEGTPRRFVGGTFTAPGYQITRRPRIRGGWFSVVITNSTLDKYWSMEHAVLHVEGQGKQR